jgi:hypothetical protein
MAYAIALMLFCVVGVTGARIAARRQERWLGEQARLDEEARRVRRTEAES